MIEPESGRVVSEIGVYVGIASNNVAEYNGLLAGLEAAYDRDPEAQVHVRMDSKLVVEQMTGRWKVKHPDMQALHRAAHQLIGARRVTFEMGAAAVQLARGCGGERVDGPSRELPPRSVSPRLDWAARMGRPDDRVADSSAPRNVRAPQGRAVGNTHPERSARQCHREQTAGGSR